MNKLKIGIVGCGKVAELCYLPASRKLNSIEISALVDINEQQLSSLAEKYNVSYRTNSIEDIYDRVDAVVVAVPNHFHAPVSIEFLRRGIHVLVEKPMALTVDECDKMIEAAEMSNSVLSVGLMRRYQPVSGFVKSILDKGILGEIISFDFSEGNIWQWDSVSDYRFKKDKGGGIFSDMGSHILDMVLWWFGEVKTVSYSDDSRGGIDANFLLEITLPNGAQGIVEVSANRNLRNTYTIVGNRGTLECGIEPQGPVSFSINGSQFVIPTIADPRYPNFNFHSSFIKQYNVFYDSVVNGKAPKISGYEGKKSLEVINRCLANKKNIDYKWEL